MRNVKKQSAEGQKIISTNKDITTGEMQQLYDIYKEQGIVELMVNAFYMGVSVGAKATPTR